MCGFRQLSERVCPGADDELAPSASLGGPPPCCPAFRRAYEGVRWARSGTVTQVTAQIHGVQMVLVYFMPGMLVLRVDCSDCSSLAVCGSKSAFLPTLVGDLPVYLNCRRYELFPSACRGPVADASQSETQQRKS